MNNSEICLEERKLEQNSTENIILFHNKSECCGCGACVNICPRNAITMKEDEFGFLYPSLDQEKCVKCGLCKKACSYHNNENMNLPKETYAAASNNDETLKKVASGGIFSILAEMVIEEDGVVFGATLEHKNEELVPMHIAIESKDELYKLQGSKYVQSAIGTTYQEAKNYLNANRKVLFSGTPCQIAGLKSYLGKQYDNLITLDIICHGVPNTKWFHDYIKVLEKQLNGKVYDFAFRDKSRGQGMNARINYYDSKNNKKVVYKDGHLISFFHYFLQMETYRENCYSCPYAGPKRVSDITIGDYWGVYNVHANEMKNSNMSNSKGVSCVLINTGKGKEVFNHVQDRLNMFESTFENVAKYNMQLKKPSEYTGQRQKLFDSYRQAGYEEIEMQFQKSIVFKKYIIAFRNALPKSWKRKMKQLLAKIKG